jgi:hypothetical protein
VPWACVLLVLGLLGRPLRSLRWRRDGGTAPITRTFKGDENLSGHYPQVPATATLVAGLWGLGWSLFGVKCNDHVNTHVQFFTPCTLSPPSKDLHCRSLVEQVCYEECRPFHTVSLLYTDTGIQIVPFKDIYDAPDVVDRKYKLDASYLEANDVIFLEFIIRRYYLNRNVKTSWSVTFDLMAIFRMLAAPDDAPVEPDSGDKRSAIVIDN